MSAIGVNLDGDQLVLTRRRDFKWVFENLDDSNPPQQIPFPPGDLFIELETGGQQNSIQEIHVANADDGYYYLTYDGEKTAKIDYWDITNNPEDQPGDITDALKALPNIDDDDIIVSPMTLHPVWRCDVTMTSSAQNEIQEVDANNFIADLAKLIGIPENEIIGSGEFKLRYKHGVTKALPFDCSAAQMQSELERLPFIGGGNVKVTAPSTYVWKIEFQGVLANRNMEQITVDYYKTKQDGLFDWLGDFLTTVTSKTTQQGRGSAFDERLVNMLNKSINDFFNLFDETLGVDIEFKINNPTPSSPPSFKPSASLIIRGLKSWEPAGIGTFLLEDILDGLSAFLNDVLIWADLFSVASTSFHWDRKFTVEFVGTLGLTSQPLITADASSLSSPSVVVTPYIEVTEIQPGVEPLTNWVFGINGAEASIKVESEEVDRIGERTRWQLVFMPAAEPSTGDPPAPHGGNPIALGRVRVQGD